MSHIELVDFLNYTVAYELKYATDKMAYLADITGLRINNKKILKLEAMLERDYPQVFANN